METTASKVDTCFRDFLRALPIKGLAKPDRYMRVFYRLYNTDIDSLYVRTEVDNMLAFTDYYQEGMQSVHDFLPIVVDFNKLKLIV